MEEKKLLFIDELNIYSASDYGYYVTLIDTLHDINICCQYNFNEYIEDVINETFDVYRRLLNEKEKGNK